MPLADRELDPKSPETQAAWRATLRMAREGAKLTQEQAGAILGKKGHTVYRWEAGLRSISLSDYEKALREYAKRQSGVVPRGTVGEQQPNRYETDTQWLDVEQADAPPRLRERYKRLIALERKMIRDGATDEEANYIRARGLAFLRSMGPEDFWGDDEDEEAGEIMLDVEFDNYLEHVVGPIVEERIEARAIQPIKPSEVPAAVEKRRAELDADSKKRRAK